MRYQFEHPASYAFLAAGSVLLSKGGSPNFSVKLGQEIFYRCSPYLPTSESLSLYDPCCGTAYWLTCLGVLNAGKIRHVFASDIDPAFLEVAQKNLQILSPQGRQRRQEQLSSLFQEYQKPSHKMALSHLLHIGEEYLDQYQGPSIKVFERDVFSTAPRPDFQVDLLLTDVPYGDLVGWQGQGGINQLLTQMIPHLHEQSVLAIVHDKYQKISNDHFQRLEKFKVGKRVIELLNLSR